MIVSKHIWESGLTMYIPKANSKTVPSLLFCHFSHVVFPFWVQKVELFVRVLSHSFPGDYCCYRVLNASQAKRRNCLSLRTFCVRDSAWGQGRASRCHLLSGHSKAKWHCLTFWKLCMKFTLVGWCCLVTSRLSHEYQCGRLL